MANEPAKPAAATAALRAALPADAPALAAMIGSADLPPMFIEEFLDGFVVAEGDGEMVACGGVEIYGACAVLRSVVVEPGARGLGLGRRIAETLIERARRAGVTDVYLFTMEAWQFWKRLGFRDVPLEAWRDEARECWQYVVISQDRDIEPFVHVHSMWRRVRPWRASASA